MPSTTPTSEPGAGVRKPFSASTALAAEPVANPLARCEWPVKGKPRAPARVAAWRLPSKWEWCCRSGDTRGQNKSRVAKANRQIRRTVAVAYWLGGRVSDTRRRRADKACRATSSRRQAPSKRSACQEGRRADWRAQAQDLKNLPRRARQLPVRHLEFPVPLTAVGLRTTPGEISYSGSRAGSDWRRERYGARISLLSSLLQGTLRSG